MEEMAHAKQKRLNEEELHVVINMNYHKDNLLENWEPVQLEISELGCALS